MKQLNSFINEKLKINSKSKIGGYDPDMLNDELYILYDDTNDSENDEVYWEDALDELKQINDKYDGFVVCRWESLTEIKNKKRHLDQYVNDYSDDLELIQNRIITGRDYGYRIRLVYGHLEFECINSGSSATYYVYALNDKAYEKIEEWFDTPESLDNEDDLNLKFLYEKGNILAIEI